MAELADKLRLAALEAEMAGVDQRYSDSIHEAADRLEDEDDEGDG